MSLFQVPWLVFGGFNEVLSNAKKMGGALRSFSQMNNFLEAITNCHLLELPFTGCLYTWTHGSRPNLTLERPDRFLASSDWSDLFPHALEHLLLHRNFDYNLILLTTSPPSVKI